MMKIIKYLAFISLSIVTLIGVAYAQITQPQGQAEIARGIYPKITGYVGIVHPLIAFDAEGVHKNFDTSYTVGMPTGINIWKSAKIGFSLEAVPYIRVENGISKMSNYLFHPGILTTLGKGFTFVGRAAFETSGRYGFTPVLNKVVRKNPHSNYFVAIPLPVRFGNDKPASLAAAFQFGLGF